MTAKLEHHVYKATENNFRNNGAALAIEASHTTNDIARLAFRLVQEWGKVPFEVDGEDSTGRQKGRRLRYEEIVSDAFAAAEMAYKKAFDDGHMIELPSLENENKYVGKEY